MIEDCMVKLSNSTSNVFYLLLSLKKEENSVLTTKIYIIVIIMESVFSGILK